MTDPDLIRGMLKVLIQAKLAATSTFRSAGKYSGVVRVPESIERARFPCDGVKVK